MKDIYKIILAAIILIFLGTGCDEVAPLSIDPIEKDIPFTFEPSHGYPGTNVKISGTGLGEIVIASVGVKEAEIASVADDEVMIVVPVGSVSGQIKLVFPSSVITSNETFAVDDSPIPTIIEFSPAIVGSGQEVVITGSLFTNVDSIYIGEIKAEILSKEENTMTIVTPTGLATGLIRMFYNYTTTYGIQKVAEAVSSIQLSLELPVIESVEPSISSLNVGDEITITGSMLSQVTNISFEGVKGSFTLIDENQIVAVVPAGAVSGSVVLTVPDGTVELSGTFNVELPVISSFIPGKGQVTETPRFFVVQGEKLDLVDSVKLSGILASIETQESSILTFSIDGSAGGEIELYCLNGTVSSETPFLLAGDFWITDYDNEYPISRFDYDQFDKVNNPVISVENTNPSPSGDNYGKYVGESKGGYSVIYWRAPDTGNNDKFTMYTDNAEGISVSFDISYSQLPDNFINDDGSVDVIVFIFTTTKKPYGFSRQINVPFAGTENWQHVSVYLTDLYEDSSVDDGTAPDSPGDDIIKPNDMRIFAITFPGANTAETGSIININFDNIKFTIE